MPNSPETRDKVVEWIVVPIISFAVSVFVVLKAIQAGWL